MLATVTATSEVAHGPLQALTKHSLNDWVVNHILCVWIYPVPLSGQSHFPSLQVLAERCTRACVLPGAGTSLEAAVEAVGLSKAPRKSKKEPTSGARVVLKQQFSNF